MMSWKTLGGIVKQAQNTREQLAFISLRCRVRNTPSQSKVGGCCCCCFSTLRQSSLAIKPPSNVTPVRLCARLLP